MNISLSLGQNGFPPISKNGMANTSGCMVILIINASFLHAVHSFYPIKGRMEWL